jgi:hypothetical protein
MRRLSRFCHPVVMSWPPDFYNCHVDFGKAPALIASGAFWHMNFTPHLTAQLNAAGIPWKNYQEDVQLSTSPKISASGNNGPVNTFNGSTQFNYAVKHNPMAFFADTALPFGGMKANQATTAAGPSLKSSSRPWPRVTPMPALCR